MNLASDPDLKELIEELLVAHYRTLVNDAFIAQIFLSLNLEDADDAAEAVRRHLRDTTLNSRNEPAGRFPPSLADIERHLEAIRKERTTQHADPERAAQALADDEQAHPSYWTQFKVPAEIRTRFGLGETIHVRRTQGCTHCGDSGMARFYYDPQNRKRVWTAREALDMPQDAFDALGLRCSEAVCICDAGDRPEASWRTIIRYKGHEERVPTVPMLAVILTLAERRRKYEQVDIGQAAPF